MSMDRVVDYLQNEFSILKAEQEAQKARLDALCSQMNEFVQEAREMLEMMATAYKPTETK